MRIRQPLSHLGASILKYVNQPLPARKPVNFSRKLLSAYRPNESFYLTPAERAQLHEIGKPNIAKRHAGVYARKLLKRLLVDLSWNSSRLEGNSYSLLETLRLVELGETVEGKDPPRNTDDPEPQRSDCVSVRNGAGDWL